MPLNSLEPTIILVRSNRLLTLFYLSFIYYACLSVVTLLLRLAPLSSSRSIKAPCNRENCLTCLLCLFCLPCLLSLPCSSCLLFLLCLKETSVCNYQKRWGEQGGREADEGSKQSKQSKQIMPRLSELNHSESGLCPSLEIECYYHSASMYDAIRNQCLALIYLN